LFADTSKKSKRRKSGHHKELAGPNVLAFAAQISLQEFGKTDVAKLFESALIAPTRVKNFLTTKVQHFAYRC
jgi:hypothetical protein